MLGEIRRYTAQLAEGRNYSIKYNRGLGHALLNAEAITALSFLILLFWRVRPAITAPKEIPVADAAVCGVLAFVIFLCYWQSLYLPLLHDSYGLVYLPSQQSPGDVLRLFYAHPKSGDFFFRPVSYLAYWLYFQWAQFDPFRWHLLSLAVHTVNCCLVYLLARRLSLARAASFGCAVLFGLHGSRPEAVVWAAARVDVFATLFVLLTLLSTLALLRTERSQWYLPMVLGTLAAVCCKESAFCLPFLAWAMLFLRSTRKTGPGSSAPPEGRTSSFADWRRAAVPFALLRNEARRGVRAISVLFLTCGIAFFYRYWVIGNVGGYGAASGQPEVLHFSLIHTVNALLYRQWALLFFPINWSTPPTLYLRAGLAVFAVMLLWLLLTARGDRRSLLAALGMTMAAALPVEHLLLISTDLSGARVLYLPTLGLALFWGLLIESYRSRKVQIGLLAGLLAFQAAALTHNLSIWRMVAFTAQRSCRYVASEISRDPSPIAVPDLPQTWRGVYFLNNSFPACVMMNSGGALRQLPPIPTKAAPGFRVYRWNESRGRIEREQ